MIGYLDLPSGISGDMWIGCLLDSGWDLDRLRDVIGKLGLVDGDWAIEARQVRKGALRATLAEVQVREPATESDSPGRSCSGHASFHGDQSVSSGHCTHRNLDEIIRIIDAAAISGNVKETAKAVFKRLAAAEAKVHGIPPNRVHFHEVGALDAIVDIVGAAAGICELGIEKLYVSALPLGGGWTDTLHGTIPLPAPAVLEILAAAGAPTTSALGEGELVTPTGAALVCELAAFARPNMRIHTVGIGAGKKDLPWPNVARLWLGTEENPDKAPPPFPQMDAHR